MAAAVARTGSAERHRIEVLASDWTSAGRSTGGVRQVKPTEFTTTTI